MSLLAFKKTDGSFRIDLDKLYLPFFEKLCNALARIENQGAQYYTTFGFRSFAQQFQLHMAWLNKSGGRAAPAGYSAHQYGLAVDFCADADINTPGLQPNWKSSAYDLLGLEMEKEGLVWGSKFNDKPHVQWPGYVTAKELTPLRDKWTKASGNDIERLKQVWSLL